MFKGKCGTMTGVAAGVKIFDVRSISGIAQGVKIIAAYAATGTTTGVTLKFYTSTGTLVRTLTSSSGIINETPTIAMNKGGIEYITLCDAQTTAGLTYAISYEY
jgi:hypothetical protein